MKIHIKNGRVIDPISQLDSQLDVYIGAGKILALGNAPAGSSALAWWIYRLGCVNRVRNTRPP
jgi:predicted amidohydrolase